MAKIKETKVQTTQYLQENKMVEMLLENGSIDTTPTYSCVIYF
jgi:hypothetical protein